MTWRVLLFVWNILRGWGGLIIGGIYTIVRGLDEVLKVMDELLYRFRDYDVFEVIDRSRTWNPPPIRTGIGRINAVDGPAKPISRAYTVKEIADELGRKEASVLRSLKRLKRTGKAVELGYGWYSKESAPKN